jgi:hypothetical protein
MVTMNRKLVVCAMFFGITLSVVAQKGAQRILLVDVSGNPYPSGSGTPLPYTPPSVICYTSSAGSILPCNFAASGGDTITSPSSTLSVGGTATATTLDINLAHANTWGAAQTFATPTIFPWSTSASITLSGAVNTGKQNTWTPTNADTAVQIEYNITAEPTGPCSPFPAVGVVDTSNSNAVLCAITVTGSTFGAHATCSSAAMTVGHTYAFGITTAAASCTTNTGGAYVTLSTFQNTN